MQHLSPVILHAKNTAPDSPVAGTIYFSSYNNTFQGWNGTAWVDLGIQPTLPTPRTTVSFTMEVAGRYGGSATGTASVRTCGNTHGATLTTGTSAGGRADLIVVPLGTGSSIWTARNPVFSWLGQASILAAEADIYFGLSLSTTINTATQVNLANAHVGFILERRGSASTWKTTNGNGGTTTQTTFTGPATAADALFSVYYDASTPSWKFYYNGTLIISHTTNLPTLSNLQGAHAAITNRSPATGTSTARLGSFSYSQDLF